MANGTYYNDGSGWKPTHSRPPLRRPNGGGNGSNSGENVAQDYFLLKSPNGTVYKVTVTDGGALQVVGVAGL